MSKSWDSIAPEDRCPDNGPGVTSKIAELQAEVERLRKAAEIFRDFGKFEHLRSNRDRQLLKEARKILKPEGDDD